MLRRLMMTGCAVLLCLPLAQADPNAAPADETAADSRITVYKSPTCGCCKNWIKHLEAAGFEVDAIDSDDMNAVKKEFAVPRGMTSCHTARVGGYTIEGHVPAADIRKLLGLRPDASGLAVPGMPVGSPGMEVGDRIDPYKVMLFGADGASTWASYDADGPREPEPAPDLESAESG